MDRVKDHPLILYIVYKMTMETIIFILNHMLTYCITVD